MAGKILFLLPYPLHQAPSQRFRLEQYLDILREEGFQLDFQTFLSEKGWEILYQKGNALRKIIHIKMGYFRRIAALWKARKADFVFIHRETTPLGPPIFEWILAKVMKKKIIYDFDDAIWLPNTTGANRWAVWLKWHRKVPAICSWSWKVSAGNAYLADFARQYCKNVVINPTTIDTERLHVPQPKENLIPIIGWTGTHSTLFYLDLILPVIERLQKDFAFEFRVISNRDPEFSTVDYQFVPWNKNTEIPDLNALDIGLMPLYDDPWSEGKCGFKALQYLALEIPTLASPVGVNKEIIKHGENGFLCSGKEDWETNLRTLLDHPQRRTSMGKGGRKKVEERYSVRSNRENFLGLFGDDFGTI